MPPLGKKIPFEIGAGVTPIPDATNLESVTYVNSDKIRFHNGKLRKLGGWVPLYSNNSQELKGASRSEFTYTPSDGIERTLIGTSDRLYVYQNGVLINITPINSTLIPINNSLNTVYYTDANYSISVTNGSNIATFNIPHFLNINDQVTISGVSGTIGGIPSTDFNNTFFVIGIPDSNSFQVEVATTATSTATGGGAGITFATSQIIVNLANHGLTKGDRIKITGAAAIGGIPAGDINIEHVVSNIISSSAFIIETSTISTSLVTSGGGGAINLQKQIASGPINFSTGFGYGGGLYGLGLYGIGKVFATGFSYPRIWSFDLYGDNVVLTPGNQGNVYLWQNDVNVAPTILTNAPTAVNWVFQSNGMVCVLGPNGDFNVMQSSNIGDATSWAISPSSTASILGIPGAGTFISQGPARNINLLFTAEKVFEMRYVNLPFVWTIEKLISTDGIIGPKARANVEDVLFWMGSADFYAYDGYTVNTLPNNTVKRYVFQNINYAQSYKTFAAFNPEYNEVWWVYPFGNSDEPNAYVIFNYKERSWAIGTIERTSAVEPANSVQDLLMTQSQQQQIISTGNNPLSSIFYTLGNNPITTTNTSAFVTIIISNHRLNIGDNVQISNAIDTNGILAAEINGVRIVTAIKINEITIETAGTATSSGAGGGNTITVGTQIINVAVTNSFTTGQIVSLVEFEAFNNFTVAEINST